MRGALQAHRCCGVQPPHETLKKIATGFCWGTLTLDRVRLLRTRNVDMVLRQSHQHGKKTKTTSFGGGLVSGTLDLSQLMR